MWNAVRVSAQVYGLNAKIAELESEMHDVVRELVRTNLDVQNIKVTVIPACDDRDVATGVVL